jgi:hypothetical membrane protein
LKRNYLLLFGPLAAIVLALGVAALAQSVPGYSHVRQTVSEIGEVGSPAQAPFAVLLCAVAACILVFAVGVRSASIEAGRSPFAAYLIACFALSATGVGLFPHPDPLHNVFGLSQLIGYQAPLVPALTWRRDPRAKALVAFSWAAFALLWLAVVLNLSSIDPDGQLWAMVKPKYGLAQRALFAAWFGWCAVVGVLLFRRKSPG